MRIDTISKTAALLAFAALLAGGSVACGGGGGGEPIQEPARSYLGTQSPGDVWAWSLERDGSFSAENQTLGHTYAGTWTELPSAFLKLIVTSTTEPGLAVPATAYAFEVHDSALVIKPAGSDANTIVAVATDACPAGSSLDLSWVELTESTWDVATGSAYGTADVTITGATWDLAVTSYHLDGSLDGTDALSGLSCVDGLVTDPADPDAILAVAPSGVFVRDAGPGQGGTIGMQRPPSAISVAALTAAGREYRGFHYKDDSSGPADSTPVWARPDGAGGLWGGEYDDIEANVEASRPPAVITFGDQLTPGIINGTLEDSAGRSDIVFLVNRLGGRYFLFGISVDTHDGHPYNFVAIETGP